MSVLSQWVDDIRWMLNMRRARAYRRGMTFSQRRRFDDALRPASSAGAAIDYPDAFYYVHSFDDVKRAVLTTYCSSSR